MSLSDFPVYILVAQVALLILSLPFSLSARGRSVVKTAFIASCVLALGALALFGASVGALAIDTGKAAQYAGVCFAAAVLQGLITSLFGVKRGMDEKRLESPAARERAADELRAILQKEGIQLDARLEAARQEREAFLYALEERHAKQIASLAQEYQHEAHSILSQLLDQLAVDQLQPMVEQRLAEHGKEIESELGAIDSVVAGEALTTVRAELKELLERVEDAESRIEQAKAENPDRDIEDLVRQRTKEVEKDLSRRIDDMVESTMKDVEIKFANVGDLVAEKVDLAANPLVARMKETEAEVEGRLNEYHKVLDTRFVETEKLLSGRVVEQEKALEQRVLEIEQGIEQRLGLHTESVNGALATHDEQLQVSLAEQSEALVAHFGEERDRLMADLGLHAVQLQEQIAAEFVEAERRAKQTVEATQEAWNQFTGELEQRFAEAREQALDAAQQIADAERNSLQTAMEQIVEAASTDMQDKVEAMGREASWHRAQVERASLESTDALKKIAHDAINNADNIFGDLERAGHERVDAIRRQAEDALVQSRDYVDSLQRSLTDHLEQLRLRANELADEMNDRLASVTQVANDALVRVDSHSRDVIDSSSRELAAVADQRLAQLEQQIAQGLTAQLKSNMEAQQHQFEQYLGEMAQRAVQQVHGDLAGLAEHARGAVTGELEQMIGQSQQQARQLIEQGHAQISSEISRQQGDLNGAAREAANVARGMLEDSLRELRRQLEEAMASMGAHMREELVRFQDEGQRRVSGVVDQLRAKEHEVLRDEDRRLTQARNELVRQHEAALKSQVSNVVTNISGSMLSGALGSPASGGSTFTARVEDVPSGFTSDIERPATPFGSPSQPSAPVKNPFGE
jgi:hypothetical protein